MYNSEVRIRYIAEYISAYESKIKLLNSEGLFDAAKLFELFAVEVGSLYFGQRLKNLNIEKFNYPTVDLISEDNTFYVQVSTAKDIPSKIKYTLEKIKALAPESLTVHSLAIKRAAASNIWREKYLDLQMDNSDEIFG